MNEEIKNEAVEAVSEVEEASSVSKSKQKREARKQEVKAEKAKKGFDKVLSWVIGLVIAAIVIGAIGMGIASTAGKTVSSDNFSEGLTAEGFIEKANLAKVKDLDLNNLVIAFSDVEVTEENLDASVNSLLSAHVVSSTDAALEVKDGDTINLDYSGSMDGVVFDGGTAEGQTLVIGSHSFVDTFEEQLIGAHPGDSVTVNVTFPDPYTRNPDFSGKAAVFECKVNSINVLPEYTDEFVKEFYSDYADTAEGLREYIKKNTYEGNISSYLTTYISDNAEVSKAPSSYVSHLKAVTKYDDEQTYEYYNNYFAYMYGQSLYSSFEDFTGKSEADYEKDLKERALKQAAEDMTYESFFKANNLTVTDEIYNTVVTSVGGEEQAASYGEAYLRQVAIKYAVIDYLTDNVNVQ